MFTLFGRKKATAADATGPAAAQAPKGFLLPETATALCATSRRQKLLEHIWQRTSLSRIQFDVLYRAPLERYALLVQQFPASENHHHCYPGGMLDHGLEIVAYALKLRQSHLSPVGATPEAQAAQAEAWAAASAYAALLHDIGKIAVDLHVEYADGERWHPWHGALVRPYRFRYREDRVYRLHNAATGLLYIDILGNTILDWLCGFPELWSALLYVLAGQYEHAGLLGELVVQADQASVAQDLGGDPARARTAPKQALQRKLLDGLRYLLKEELKLNQPQASDGWLTQDALWLVSKTVCDKLRAHLLAQGIEGIPDKNTAVFNVLQDHAIAQATPTGKAIWKATVAGDNGWTQGFTFLKVAPALIWDLVERPAAFAGSVNVEETSTVAIPGESLAPAGTVITAPMPMQSQPMQITPVTSSLSVEPLPAAKNGDSVDDILALLDGSSTIDIPSSMDDAEPVTSNTDDRDPTEASAPWHSPPSNAAEPLGTRFLSWLRDAIQKRRLKINDAQALVHTVAGTAYVVTPGIFQRFTREHPDVARLPRDPKFTDWMWVQKNFEKLRIHKKQPTGLNIWTCEVSGPRKKTRRLHGYLLNDPRVLFNEVPFDNPYLAVMTSSTES